VIRLLPAPGQPHDIKAARQLIAGQRAAMFLSIAVTTPIGCRSDMGDRRQPGHSSAQKFAAARVYMSEGIVERGVLKTVEGVAT